MDIESQYHSMNESGIGTTLENSFLLGGATDPYLIERPKSDPGTEALLETEMGLRRSLKDNTKDDNILDQSFQLGCDINKHGDVVLPGTDNDGISTEWGNTIILFVVTALILPYYALALISHIRKDQQGRLTNKKAYTIIGICLTLYSLFWVFLGLFWGLSKNPLMSWSEPVFLVLLYFVCCFSEAAIKTTTYKDNHTYSGDVTRSIHSIHISAGYVDAGDAGNNRQGVISLGDLCVLIRKQTVSRKVYIGIRVLSVVLGCVFAVFVEVSRWIFIDSADKTITAGLIIYVGTGWILRFTLSSFIFFYLGESLVQLYARVEQSKVFNALTSSSAALHYNIPSFKLDSRNNIQAWQILRAYLLHEYQQPKIYVDVVLSACFSMWLPLMLVSGLLLFVGKHMTMFIATCSLMAVIIFVYLIICVVLASRCREGFNQIGIFHAEEYRLLCKANVDSADVSQIISVLEKLREIIRYGEGDAIVFRILGFGINKNLSTLLFGLLVTVGSTVLTQILAS